MSIQITYWKYIILITLFLVPNNCFAQLNGVGFKIGYGSFDMNDIKSIQKDVFNNLQINGAEIVESFPMFFDLSLVYQAPITNSMEFKFNLGFTSTGGRISYSDFSGYYTYDQLANQSYISSGLKIYHSDSFFKKIGVKSYFELLFGYGLSSIQFKQELNLYDESSSNKVDFLEHSIFTVPTFGFQLPFHRFKLEPYFGYYFDLILNGLYLDENIDSRLRIDDRDANASWKGIRTGLIILFNF